MRWLYEWAAPLYDTLSGPLVDTGAIIEIMQLAGTESVLDVAGGTGRLAHAIASRSRARVTVLDAAKPMLAQVPAHSRLNKVHAPAHSLPFAAESFDWVLCTNAFHLLTPHAQALASMRRVLKPGGKLLILDFNPRGLASPLLRRIEPMLDEARFLSTEELESLAREQGFSGQFVPFSLFQYLYVAVKL